MSATQKASLSKATTPDVVPIGKQFQGGLGRFLGHFDFLARHASTAIDHKNYAEGWSLFLFLEIATHRKNFFHGSAVVTSRPNA